MGDFKIHLELHIAGVALKFMVSIVLSQYATGLTYGAGQILGMVFMSRAREDDLKVRNLVTVGPSPAKSWAL